VHLDFDSYEELRINFNTSNSPIIIDIESHSDDLKMQAIKYQIWKRKLMNKIRDVHSKGFWRLCITLRITGFLDFVHRMLF
jgi:hypothetical protein